MSENPRCVGGKQRVVKEGQGVCGRCGKLPGWRSVKTGYSLCQHDTVFVSQDVTSLNPVECAHMPRWLCAGLLSVVVLHGRIILPCFFFVRRWRVAESTDYLPMYVGATTPTGFGVLEQGQINYTCVAISNRYGQVDARLPGPRVRTTSLFSFFSQSVLFFFC